MCRTALRKEVISVTELARGVAAEHRQREPARNVALDIADRLSVYGDPSLITIVLVNLLGNAWKYTAKQQDARIAFGQENNENEPVFYVRDNGAGFDMAYANKLFAPFQRLHPDFEFEGAWIGLATVERISCGIVVGSGPRRRSVREPLSISRSEADDDPGKDDLACGGHFAEPTRTTVASAARVLLP